MKTFFMQGKPADPHKLALGAEVTIVADEKGKVMILAKGNLHQKPFTGDKFCKLKITCVFVGGSIKGHPLKPGKIAEIPTSMLYKLST